MTDLINRADAVSTVIKWASGEGGDMVDLIESLPSAHVKTDGDLISRQIAIDGVIKSCLGVSNVVIAEAKAINYIKKIPSASAEQVTGKLNNRDDSLLTDDVEECKEQKIKLDLISRQMAIEVVQNRHIMLNKEKVLLINDLEKLPSAQLATDTNVGTKLSTDLAELGTDSISRQ